MALLQTAETWNLTIMQVLNTLHGTCFAGDNIIRMGAGKIC